MLHQQLLFPARLNARSSQAKDLTLWWPGGDHVGGIRRNRPTTFGSARAVAADDMLGRVWKFDGTTNSFINLSPTVFGGLQWQTAGGHTLTAWVKLGAFNSSINQYIVNMTSGSLTIRCFELGGANDLRVGNDVNFGGGAVATFTTAPSLNVWYHLAYTWQSVGGTSTHKAYLNGILVDTTTLGEHSSALIVQFDLGRRNDVGGQGSNFTGWVGDTRLYTRALSDAEIWKQYDPATRWDLYQPYDIYAFKSPAGAVTPLSSGGSLTAAGALVRRINKPVDRLPGS
jgi:hypothetical protein